MSRYTDQLGTLATRTLADPLVGAETVTREILGDQGDTESVTAIVDLENEDDGGQGGGGLLVHDENKTEIMRRATLEIDADQTVDDRDTWLIGGERWRTIRVSARDDGMQSVEVQQRVPIRTMSGRRRDI